jgi:hypothetical protein
LRAGDNICKPGKDFGGARGGVEEGEEGKQARDAEAVDRNTGFGALPKEAGRLPFNSEAIEGARAVVGVGVAGGEDRGYEERVSDVWEAFDAKVWLKIRIEVLMLGSGAGTYCS